MSNFNGRRCFAVRFTYKKRQLLEEYLQKKVTITMIAQIFNVSRQTVYSEIKKGLSEEDKVLRRYKNYSADLAQKIVEETVMGRIK